MNPAQPGSARQVWLLVALTLGCLLPFLSKPFHMDDPLFIWTARHIQKEPLDFYNFDINWYGVPGPMYSVTQNPPLASYYMAIVGSLFGWGETALHFGFLWPAVAVIVGVYFLGHEFCAHPLFAALATLVAPGFLVSSTTLMCDVMMLAFWVWSLFFWLRGLEQSSQRQLALAALLAAAAGLTKYFGFCLLPLMAVYGAMKTRRAGLWLLHLSAVALIAAAYFFWTDQLYGRSLLFSAVGYAVNLRVGGGPATKFAVGLAFLGGCMLLVVPALPLLWGRRGCVAAVLGLLAFCLILAAKKSLGRFGLFDSGRLNWPYIVQWSILAVGGAAILFLTMMDLLRGKDAKSTLLALWLFGTFLFAFACNWTVAARNILPLIPATAFLLVRRLDLYGLEQKFHLLCCPLALSLAAAMMLAWADFKMADSARTAAQTIYEKVVWHFKTILFEGHWGFQYYMEQLGAHPVEKDNLQLTADTALVLPLGNSLIAPPSGKIAVLWNELDLTQPFGVAVMSGESGAGFYSDGWGPAPFMFGVTPVDKYQIYSGK